MSRGMVRRAALACALFLAAGAAWAQPSGLSLGLRLSPGIALPLGDSADLCKPGFGAGAAALAHLGGLPWLAAGLGATTRLTGAGGAVLPAVAVPPLLRPSALPAGGFLKISDVELQPVFPVLFKY